MGMALVVFLIILGIILAFGIFELVLHLTGYSSGNNSVVSFLRNFKDKCVGSAKARLHF